MSFPSTVPGTSPLGYMGTKTAKPIALVDQTRDPQISDARNYDIGTVWVNHAANTAFILTSKPGNAAFWLPAGGGSSSISQVTTNAGVALAVGGNINILGTGGNTTSAAGATITATNLRYLSPLVVDAAGGAEFTDITTAMFAATAGQTIYIRPGVYAEPFLGVGVTCSFVGATGDDGRSAVTINGNIAINAGITVSFKNLNILGTAGASGILVGGLGGPNRLIVSDCNISSTGADGILSNPGTSTTISLTNCIVSGSTSALTALGNSAMTISGGSFTCATGPGMLMRNAGNSLLMIDATINGLTQSVFINDPGSSYFFRNCLLISPNEAWAFGLNPSPIVEATHCTVDSSTVSTFFVSGAGGDFRYALLVMKGTATVIGAGVVPTLYTVV